MHDLQADCCYFPTCIKGLCLHAMLELVIMKHPLLQHGPEELLFWVLITCWVLQERKKASNMEQPSCQGEKQMGSSQSYTDCLSQALSQPILEMGKHGAGAR